MSSTAVDGSRSQVNVDLHLQANRLSATFVTWHENVDWTRDVDDGNDDVADHPRIRVDSEVRRRPANSNCARPDHVQGRYAG